MHKAEVFSDQLSFHKGGGSTLRDTQEKHQGKSTNLPSNVFVPGVFEVLEPETLPLLFDVAAHLPQRPVIPDPLESLDPDLNAQKLTIQGHQGGIGGTW